MSIESGLKERSGNSCELCGSTENLIIYTVPPKLDESMDHSALICSTCKTGIENPDSTDTNHWRCLNDSMWNENSPVKVLAYRMLYNLKSQGWTQDLLDMMYLEEEDQKWAHATLLAEGEEAIIHKDSNGAILSAGDTVVLIKDLDVKGGGFTAKRGTAVRNIALDRDNASYIEGKVEGQTIAILTQYVKKA